MTFLVGAGRSGTTLLYKVLCLHSDIAYLNNYHNRLPWLRADLLSKLALREPHSKMAAWFNDAGNAYFVNRPWLKKLIPTPVEGEAFLASCGLPLFPDENERLSKDAIDCLHHKFSLLQQGTNAKTVVCKRTANNRRIPLLESAFPTARYIHLIRDGRDVTHSLSKVEWWDNLTLWWDGRTTAQLEAAGEDRLRICARNWVREVEKLRCSLAAVAQDRRLEIRYEAFLAQPMTELGKIFDFLNLPFDQKYRDAVTSLKLKTRPKAWSNVWSAEQLSGVLRETDPLLSQLGYR